MHNNRQSRRSQWNRNSTTFSGYFNPEALETSVNLVGASLETVSKNCSELRNFVENEQTEQAIMFFDRILSPQLNSIRRQLVHTSYLERQKIQEGIQASGGTGTRTHSPSMNVRQIVDGVRNDPRKLRELQDELGRVTAAAAS